MPLCSHGSTTPHQSSPTAHLSSQASMSYPSHRLCRIISHLTPPLSSSLSETTSLRQSAAMTTPSCALDVQAARTADPRSKLIAPTQRVSIAYHWLQQSSIFGC